MTLLEYLLISGFILFIIILGILYAKYGGKIMERASSRSADPDDSDDDYIPFLTPQFLVNWIIPAEKRKTEKAGVIWGRVWGTVLVAIGLILLVILTIYYLLNR